jgi:hypothetical protein
LINKSAPKPTPITIPTTPGTVFFDLKKSSKPDGSLNADNQLHELQQTLSGADSGAAASSTAEAASSTGTATSSTGTAPSSTGAASISTGAASSSAEPQLRGLSGSASVSANQGTGSVESFFQIDNNGRTPASQYTSNNKTASRLLSEFNSPEPRKSAAGAPFRFLWHVMDNAGVPMFVGKNDDDLDPSLRQGYQGQNFSGQSYSGQSHSTAADYKPTSTVEGTNGVPRRSAVSAPSPGPHKIPESELEGTDSWVKDNDQMP